MNVATAATDDLDITLVKNHLNVDVSFTDDDALIHHYMKSSLESVEVACHAHFLKREYVNTPDEIIPKYRNLLILYIDVLPRAVYVTIDGNIIDLNRTQWYYCSGVIEIYLNSISGDVTEVTAATGQQPIQPIINQARLSAIASWYATREMDVIGSIASELPSGALKFILPMMQEAAI